MKYKLSKMDIALLKDAIDLLNKILIYEVTK